MPTKFKGFQMGAIPDAVLQAASDRVSPYATAFVSKSDLVGGGTFARVNGRAGILTAAHVWNYIWNQRHLTPDVQLIVARGPHTFPLRIEHLTAHLALKRKSDQWGPDLQFVEIPSVDAAKINATKAFVEITGRANKWWPLAKREDGVMVNAGMAAAFVQKSPIDSKGIQHVTLRGGFISNVTRKVKKGRFDYLETLADYVHAKGLPRSFGGVSGSGLWRMPIHAGKGGTLDGARAGDEFALAGVAFYEESMGENKLIIRYHGPETIYSVLGKLVPPV